MASEARHAAWLRRAYRRYGARFEVDGEGELTLKLDLNLDGGIMSLTSTR